VVLVLPEVELESLKVVSVLALVSVWELVSPVVPVFVPDWVGRSGLQVQVLSELLHFGL
jgi:hypothetical protein